ncbi:MULTISPECIES: ATP-binding protein [Burkholderiaceae]|uniref:ATP-binding protein n=1 Tax=Burkholderiaceae TaxID=119060 RepID=UPI000961BF1F|nr:MULTISPECIES: ATP-binding protein [Burkholderiaceae]MCG1040883.1 HAMP domain-containing protein [Mycetohabitans sp. B7]SIT65203.1 two-component system, OmpR family, sensor kinase [Burkholderia sp. b14]
MLRSLIRLYLAIIVVAGAAITLVNVSFVRIFHERASEQARNSLTTYAFVLTDFLKRHAGDQRTAALRELSKHGNEGLSFMTWHDVERLLEARQSSELRAGKIALSMGTKHDDMPMPDGMVVHASPEEPPHLDLQIYAYGFIAFATLLAVWTWIHYHWRDLHKLEAAVRAFGAGKLSTRAQVSSKSNIYALSRQFNEMAEQIEASILQQRDMMYGISHELKTPLARLKFGLALLASPDSPERQRERHDALHADVRELDDLITELLTLCRLEQLAPHKTPTCVAVDELLYSVAGSVAHDVGDRGLTLSVSIQGSPQRYVCDPKLVARALLNLVRNGLRYANSNITLSATTDAHGALQLVVEDDGPGIPVEDRQRVFEPFYQPHSSRDLQTSGFGLGLAIVRRIALLHGGRVWLEQGALGGARFVMTLPALPGEEP